MLPDKHLILPSVMTITSPLIHSDERVEVMQRFRREPFLLDGEILDIPVLSGNAIRGMLRRATALRVCDALDIRDRHLPVASFYLLFSGGYLEGSEPSVNIDELVRLREVFVPLALLGGSRGARVHHGLLDVWRGEPMCAELQASHERDGHEDDYRDSFTPSVFDLLTETSYSRLDDRPDLDEQPKAAVQMRYSYEALVPGTRLLHGCVVRTREPTIVGCLLDAIRILEQQQSVGGRAAIGHGRFRWTWAHDHPDADELIAGYHGHLAERGEEIRELLGVRAEALR